ncbi:DUF4138 domain-containing protein [Mucilaginibacter terrigena]|uniref:DUF4138 domain-containing protein n=1 Tax=Mucilaginibacter terrigena TaxID=2492395 RepID=A0A4Q5LNM9_9SPHI|nr:DUF4138 domain-containing protein [Mucilaginibacter terrigena]RYU90949.1 DUF4138 domain-containing protein [Mucilaginibacter terrigena]
MKKLISILFFAAVGTVSFAQDTAYISRDKFTALIFPSSVNIVGKVPEGVNASNKGSGVITLQADKATLKPSQITAQDQATNQIYRIPVRYSYGRAGRRIEIGQTVSSISVIRSPQINYVSISNELAAGKRKDVIDRKKTGGVKTWISKLSIADNRIFFRVDISNHSGLPYEVDFIRFYIRDLKTVSRMATHEQEIIPVYSTFKSRVAILKNKELAKVFAFRRFSLTEDQALNIEIYERNGNRHLYLQIKQKDLDDLKIIIPATQQPANTLAAKI